MFSIVIPTFNKLDLLKRCLTTIVPQTGDTFEIIIVDNGSTEKYVPDNAEKNTTLIRLPQNQGFSAAVNRGIKESQGEFIAVLNNDTELAPGWAQAVLKAFGQNPDIYFVTSKIKNLKNRDLLDSVGDVLLSSGKVYKTGNNEKDSGQYDVPRHVFGASGCASIFRREFFDKAGYFDEDFFAYLEDIDLSFRATLFGFKGLYVPEAVVYHAGSATTGSQYNSMTAFYLAQNTINVIVKNFPSRLLITSFPAIVRHLLLLQVFFIFKGLGFCFFKGILSGIKQVKIMRRKRKGIMGKKVLSVLDVRAVFKRNHEEYDKSKRNRVKRPV
jgi:GT2 family glycosyltransferase